LAFKPRTAAAVMGAQVEPDFGNVGAAKRRTHIVDATAVEQ
jgi:hypothetical protein